MIAPGHISALLILVASRIDQTYRRYRDTIHGGVTIARTVLKLLGWMP